MELTVFTCANRPDPTHREELRALLWSHLKVEKQLAELSPPRELIAAALGRLDAASRERLERELSNNAEKARRELEQRLDSAVTQLEAAPLLRARLSWCGCRVELTTQGQAPWDPRGKLPLTVRDGVHEFSRGRWSLEVVDEHATEADAARAFSAQRAELEKLGWLVHESRTERVEVVPLEGTVAHHVAQVPDDADAAQVLIDALLEQGDARGALARRALAGADPDVIVSQNRALLLGPLAELWGSLLRAQWRYGLVVGASLCGRHERAPNRRTVDVGVGVAQLSALPFFETLERLEVGLPGADDNEEWSEALRQVVAAPFAPRLRALTFDPLGSDDYQISWLRPGDLAVDWSALSSLESLKVCGRDAAWGALRLPRLKRFVRETGGLGRVEFEQIIAAEWPMLRHFELWVGAEEYGAEVTLADLERLLRVASAWPLASFGVVNCAQAGELVPLLAAQGWLERLSCVDLSKGGVGDEDVDLLGRCAARLARLDRLDLSESRLSAHGVAAVRRLLPNAVLDAQRAGDDHFVAVGE